MEILIAFVLKTLDNALSTAKTIYISKEKYFLGSLFNAFACFFYLIAIVQMTKDSSFKSILAMCVATFVGSFIPGILFKKSERDKLYIFDITSHTLEAGIAFADKIRQHDLAIKTFKSYDSRMNETLSCKIYCATKEESKLVNQMIDKKFKYHIYIPIEE